MSICSWICFDLTSRCYCGRQQTNMAPIKKLEILLTSVSVLEAPPFHRPSQNGCSPGTPGCSELQRHCRQKDVQWCMLQLHQPDKHRLLQVQGRSQLLQSFHQEADGHRRRRRTAMRMMRKTSLFPLMVGNTVVNVSKEAITENEHHDSKVNEDVGGDGPRWV